MREIPEIPMQLVPAVTSMEMAAVDQAMVDDYGIDLIQMMENAGRALAALARDRFLDGDRLADLGWYSLGRRQGPWLIDVACGLSSNPMACLLTVKNRLSRLGTPYIVLAKMVPGSGNLIAVAAGLAGFGTLRFILADAASLILWASIYTGTGWILSDRVAPAIEWAVTYNRAVVVVLILIVLAAAFRLWKVRLHQEAHRRMDPTPLA